MSQPNPWTWDPRSRQWFIHDARTDEIVYEDGRRVPRTALTGGSASASDYVSSPTQQNRGYVHQAFNSGRSVQGSSGGQGLSRSIAGPASDAMSRASADMANLSMQAPRKVQTGTAHPATASSARETASTGAPQVIDYRHPRTQVRNVIQTAPPEQTTDPRLLNAGVSARGMLLETDGDFEPLNADYRKRKSPRNFFVRGRVFFTLWAEPAGTSNSQATGQVAGYGPGRYGEQVFSKIRRFVVVLEADNFCTCLPVTTYGYQGVAKFGVTKAHHSIIHTSSHAPRPLAEERHLQRGEEPMQPEAIRVDVDDQSDKLESLSRLDYGKPHTIHHNLKVKNLGKVHPRSMNAFVEQWTRVTQQLTANSGLARSAQANSLRMNPTPLPVIAEGVTAQQRRQSDVGQIHSERAIWAPNTRGGVPAPAISRTGARPPVRHGAQGSGDSGSGSGSASDGSDDDDEETAVARRPQPSPPTEASHNAAEAAVTNLMRRGYTAEQASQAVARLASTRRSRTQRDGEDNSQSEGSSQGPASTQRSGRSRGSSGRPSNSARGQRADSRTGGNPRSVPSASSHAQTRGQIEQSRQAAQRQQAGPSRSGTIQEPPPSTSQTRLQPVTTGSVASPRTTPAVPASTRTASSGAPVSQQAQAGAARGSGGQTNPQARTQQPQPPVASSSSTTSPRPTPAVPATSNVTSSAAQSAANQRLWEAQIQRLVDQGLTRSQAIARLQAHYANSGNTR